MNKKKIMSAIVAATLSMSSMSCVLADTAADTGKYQITQKAEDVAETAKLASEKPVILSQMEYLGRGVVAVSAEKGMFVSWRMLGTDDTSIKFNVYRDDKLITSQPIENTSITDPNGTLESKYSVVPVLNGAEALDQKAEQIMSAGDYISIKVEPREGYDINDVSVGDLDGDGEYEFVVRRNPLDMELATRTCYPLIEAYKLDGTHMWTINIGPNEINTIDINFLVYDFDGDGKAEVVTRSFEETIDGVGDKIGDTNDDDKTNYEDSIAKFKDRQYLSAGPEFLSVYDGMTGKELARTDLLPSREPLVNWGGFPAGDNRNVKRSAHFMLAVAYLDGKTPSIVHMRGAWNSVGLAAWNYKDGKLKELWEHKNETSTTNNNLYGAGYHSLAVADVDFDGKDEILSGAFSVDHDGETMYATSVNGVKLGHGDAFDVAIMSPDNPGYYVWACHEVKELPTNIELHDARTGEVIYGYTKPKDTGRSRAADIDPTNPGWEMWGSTATPIHNMQGEVLADDGNGNAPVSMNMKLYWDGDLLSELMDHTGDVKTVGYGAPCIQKWNWETKTMDMMLELTDCASLGGTKGQEPLVADIWGDWRDEFIVRDIDNTELRIYTTNIATEYRMPTLMHDRTYREAIAWQNNHYNQPANTSFYLGAETEKVPVPEIYTVKGTQKVSNPVYTADASTHAYVAIKTNDPEDVVASMSPLAKAVVLKIGSPNAYVAENTVKIDADNDAVVPVIENDRTLVPLRFLSENFDATVEWDGDTQTVTLTKGEDVIKMVIGQSTYTVNGEEKTLDCPAAIVNDRTMVPVRAVLESFGKQLSWNDGIVVIADEEVALSAEEVQNFKDTL